MVKGKLICWVMIGYVGFSLLGAGCSHLKKVDPDDAEEQFNLAAMYHQGDGFPQDYKQAVAWYTKAAEQGHAQAQFALGDFYIKGQGVPQDLQQAFMWWARAAEQGDVAAQFNLAACRA